MQIEYWLVHICFLLLEKRFLQQQNLISMNSQLHFLINDLTLNKHRCIVKFTVFIELISFKFFIFSCNVIKLPAHYL